MKVENFDHVPQVKQIKKAKRAYILELTASPNSMTDRYAIYTDSGNGKLEILWGDNRPIWKDSNTH